MNATQTTMLNIKTPVDLKKELQNFASEFGISVSAIINNAIRNVLIERRVEFVQDFAPNKKTSKILKAAIVDSKNGENLSPKFANAKDMDAYLDNL